MWTQQFHLQGQLHLLVDSHNLNELHLEVVNQVDRDPCAHYSDTSVDQQTRPIWVVSKAHVSLRTDTNFFIHRVPRGHLQLLLDFTNVCRSILRYGTTAKTSMVNVSDSARCTCAWSILLLFGERVLAKMDNVQVDEWKHWFDDRRRQNLKDDDGNDACWLEQWQHVYIPNDKLIMTLRNWIWTAWNQTCSQACRMNEGELRSSHWKDLSSNAWSW